MNKKLLKALSTITLSLVLTTAAIAGTALAAENWDPEDCTHPVLIEQMSIDRYEEANSMYHWGYATVTVICEECENILGTYEIVEPVVYEEHDLIGSANGYYWVCVDCDAHIIAGTK